MIRLKNWPTDSRRITSPFGPRWGDFHDGIDIGALIPGVEGDKLYAVADGLVIISKVNGGGVTKGYGYYIVIQHDGFSTLYGHLQELILNVGQTVRAGEIIGKMGNTGTSTGAHLHFRLSEGNYNSNYFRLDENGKTYGSINPEPFLNSLLSYEEIINECFDQPEKWKKGVNALVTLLKDKSDLGDLEILKFLPEGFVKIYQHASRR